VQALKRAGLVDEAPRGGLRLGPAVFPLARSAERQTADDVPMIALPFMQDLVEETGETAILTVPHGLQTICLQTVEGPQPLHVSFPRLSVAPLYAGSAVAALAHLDERVIRLVIEGAASRRYADGSAVTRRHLEAQMTAVREQGYAVSRGEVDPHATSVGVPLFEGPGRCVAAMSVAAPSERVDDDILAQLVRAATAAAASVSERLTSLARLESG
jgi:DNA-binding IclR family transcriptional regulator